MQSLNMTRTTSEYENTHFAHESQENHIFSEWKHMQAITNYSMLVKTESTIKIQLIVPSTLKISTKWKLMQSGPKLYVFTLQRFAQNWPRLSNTQQHVLRAVCFLSTSKRMAMWIHRHASKWQYQNVALTFCGNSMFRVKTQKTFISLFHTGFPRIPTCDVRTFGHHNHNEVNSIPYTPPWSQTP